MPVLLLAALSCCAVETINLDRLNRIEPIVQAAIDRHDIPGAVVLILNHDTIVYRKAFGNRALTPKKESMTIDTIFDLASLTKPIATATCIFKLIEEGQLKLDDPIAKHWPAFAANGKAKVTIEDCLLHRSGLTPDNSIADYVGNRDEIMDRVAELSLIYPTGTDFRYSDVGFIVLGEVVQRLTDTPLDTFAKETIFEPLKMSDTSYNPKTKERVAPTSSRKGEPIRGNVHDPRAFALGGVAGHAGLFSNADDLARFCRMLLHQGELDGQRILSPLAVRLLLEPVKLADGNIRSRGWDVATAYSSQRGELFPKGDGFGHTGFTGTSIWIDPPSQTAIIILTNRAHPNDKGSVTTLRHKIATIVAGAIIPRETK